MKRYMVVIQMIVILSVTALSGCVHENGPQDGEVVNLLITGDYGANRLLQMQIPYKKDMDVLDVLTASGVEVETMYGGGFVKRIGNMVSEANGVSGIRKDWFYYINGIFADVGFSDYFPQPGENIWWDYHPWKMAQSIAAVIGAYPEPFVHGYRGEAKDTIIMYAQGNKEGAEKLKAGLEKLGVKKVVVQEPDRGKHAEHDNPMIIIGEWGQLREYKSLMDWSTNAVKNGAFVSFGDDRLELYNYSGRMVRSTEDSAGVIAAIGEGSGDESPFWLVTGTNYEGLSYALDTLVNHYDNIQGFYQAVILSDEIIRLPLMED